MPFVLCPACGQDTFTLFGSAPQRTCGNCGQVFWVEANRPKATPPPGAKRPPPGAARPSVTRSSELR